jgi:UDP-N-acetylmuramate--alanine ligase
MKHIYFIGIGGIGLSALARYLKKQGFKVSGSDIKETTITQKLQSEGIKVKTPQIYKNIEEPDMVIYSAVIKESNPEMQAAHDKSIQTYSRKEALKFILGDKQVYSVCGAHGKSTTSAMLASVMQKSMLIGAESKEYGTNMHYVDNRSIVFEADESDSSFLNSNPHVAIVTNAEPEHMEHYDYDMDRFEGAYRQYLEMAEIRVINAEDPFLATLDIEATRLYPSRDIRDISTTIVGNEPYTTFQLKDLGAFRIWGIGEHIALNASLVILAALKELDLDTIKQRMLDYRGIKKRFDIIKKESGQIVIDDYAHHPTEITATLNSVKAYAKEIGIDTIHAIWQPHKYSRTVDNLEGYIQCFEGVDSLTILPVWTVGEEKVAIDFEKHFAPYRPTFLPEITKEALKPGIVVGLGAGDITYQLRSFIQ